MQYKKLLVRISVVAIGLWAAYQLYGLVQTDETRRRQEGRKRAVQETLERAKEWEKSPHQLKMKQEEEEARARMRADRSTKSAAERLDEARRPNKNNPAAYPISSVPAVVKAAVPSASSIRYMNGVDGCKVWAINARQEDGFLLLQAPPGNAAIGQGSATIVLEEVSLPSGAPASSTDGRVLRYPAAQIASVEKRGSLIVQSTTCMLQIHYEQVDRMVEARTQSIPSP